jgi:hypothetical protein
VSPESGGALRRLAGAALDHTAGHQNMHRWASRVDGANAHTPRGSRERLEYPWRPAPERGGAGLAGVRVPVLQCTNWTKKGGEVLLTTQGRRRRAGRRGRYCGGEDQRWRRFGGAPAARMKGVLKRACLQSESKGGSGSSGLTLNSHRERGRRGEAEGACGGRRLPLMVAVISGRGEGKGNRRFENASKCRLDWPTRAGRKGREGGRARRDLRRRRAGRGRGGGQKKGRGRRHR